MGLAPTLRDLIRARPALVQVDGVLFISFLSYLVLLPFLHQTYLSDARWGSIYAGWSNVYMVDIA